MLKPIIAGIAALSLTLVTAAPAQANGFEREDIGKLLIGIATVAALSKFIESDRRDDRATPAQQQVDSHNSWADLNRPRQRDNTRSRHRDLPHACLRSIETRFGTQRMFVQQCLERSHVRVNRLPDRCAVRVISLSGPRSGFDPYCLRDAGYRSTRRN